MENGNTVEIGLTSKKDFVTMPPIFQLWIWNVQFMDSL